MMEKNPRLRPLLFTQLLFELILILSGIAHIISRGYMSVLGIPIIVGFVCLLCTVIQFRCMGTQFGCCHLATAVICCILAGMVVPVITVIAMALGDAFGQPYRSCRWIGRLARNECFLVTYAPNVGALIADCVNFLGGIVLAVLLAITTQFLRRCMDRRQTDSVDEKSYQTPPTDDNSTILSRNNSRTRIEENSPKIIHHSNAVVQNSAKFHPPEFHHHDNTIMTPPVVTTSLSLPNSPNLNAAAAYRHSKQQPNNNGGGGLEYGGGILRSSLRSVKNNMNMSIDEHDADYYRRQYYNHHQYYNHDQHYLNQQNCCSCTSCTSNSSEGTVAENHLDDGTLREPGLRRTVRPSVFVPSQFLSQNGTYPAGNRDETMNGVCLLLKSSFRNPQRRPNNHQTTTNNNHVAFHHVANHQHRYGGLNDDFDDRSNNGDGEDSITVSETLSSPFHIPPTSKLFHNDNNGRPVSNTSNSQQQQQQQQSSTSPGIVSHHTYESLGAASTTKPSSSFSPMQRGRGSTSSGGGRSSGDRRQNNNNNGNNGGNQNNNNGNRKQPINKIGTIFSNLGSNNNNNKKKKTSNPVSDNVSQYYQDEQDRHSYTNAISNSELIVRGLSTEIH